MNSVQIVLITRRSLVQIQPPRPSIFAGQRLIPLACFCSSESPAVIFDRGKIVSISFGKSDCTVFRKVLSTEDMAGVGVIVGTREYRAKWYGEDEEMAKACASGLEGDGSRNRKSASAN